MTAKQPFHDICDYLDWRGDLSFEASPLNEVDALIFCQLSYLHLDGLLTESFDSPLPLSLLAERFFAAPDFARRADLGLLIDPRTTELLQKAAASRRFGPVGLAGFVSKYDARKEEQFSALTFYYEKNAVFLAYRGTDDTLIGWKEDFNLAFMESLPAQKDALHYAEKACSAFRKAAVTLGGHSKGGNLAIYAAASLPQKMQKRLCAVYNFDGPGFSAAMLQSPPFTAIQSRVRSVFPQFSIIGMLFHHYEDFAVVPSRELLVMQHNPFSWQVKGAAFERRESLDSGSELFFASFNKWFESLSRPQREQFVETLFGVLLATNARTNSELSGDLLKNAGKILKAFAALDASIRDDALRIAGDFVKTITKESLNRKPPLPQRQN